jgi:hypothetical protein
VHLAPPFVHPFVVGRLAKPRRVLGDGNSRGFRINVPGKGKYLLKLDDASQPELSTAATVIGAAAERDAAWMARVLARFTPESVRLLAESGRFTDPRNTDYVARVLEGRLSRILDRYLTRLSSIADVHVEGDELCAVDLAARRGVRESGRFRYTARTNGGVPLRATSDDGARVCVGLVHVAADDGGPDDAPNRYVRVVLEDGVAVGPLRAYLYDFGPARGYRLAGIERTEG